MSIHISKSINPHLKGIQAKISECKTVRNSQQRLVVSNFLGEGGGVLCLIDEKYLNVNRNVDTENSTSSGPKC